MTNISSSAQSLVGNAPSLEKEALLDDIHTLESRLEVMERFVSRRFDEISMEINATSQQLDMAEEGMVGKIVEVMQVLSAISYSGDGSSAANTGVELESVIETTEKAAIRFWMRRTGLQIGCTPKGNGMSQGLAISCLKKHNATGRPPVPPGARHCDDDNPRGVRSP